MIPARGGSKGIFRKNSRIIEGLSLLARSILIAQKTEEISLVVVSTDDAVLAREAENLGALVPFLRPAHLANDDTPMVDVIHHVVNSLASSTPTVQFPDDYEAIVLLQPTSPMRKRQHIRDAIHSYYQSRKQGKDVACVMAVSPVPQEYYLSNLWELEYPSAEISQGQGILLRKPQEPLIHERLFYRNGAVVVLHPEYIDALTLSSGPVFPYLVDETLVSIDNVQDLLIVEHCGRPLEPGPIDS